MLACSSPSGASSARSRAIWSSLARGDVLEPPARARVPAAVPAARAHRGRFGRQVLGEQARGGRAIRPAPGAARGTAREFRR